MSAKKGQIYFLSDGRADFLAQDHRHAIEPLVADAASEEFPPLSHPGTELLHLLEGKLVYRHGNQLYPMQPGDSLTGKPPHTPCPHFQVTGQPLLST